MPDLKQKAMVALMYSSGLRIGELCHLRYEDIQRKSMHIHIRHGKNRSDRYAILSKQSDSSRPIDTFYLSRHIHDVEQSLGWEKRITCHSLRHAFGTHLYEDGIDLLTIKALLEHKSLNSTTIYVHLASNGISNAVSPFDLIGGGHVEIHNNSCRNRNYPNCQAIFKEVWIDARKSEVIDAPYFHVVFTVPSELNPLIYANQELLYALLHRCSSETLLELSSDKKYLGATPGIIQVLHTWGQTLNYHPHIHCIVTGGGLTKDYRLKTSSDKFFIPVKVLGAKFLACLNSYQRQGRLVLPSSCEGLRTSYAWAQYRDGLYKKEWCPYMFQKIRYYGFLNNRNKKKNLSIIFRIQGHQKFTSKFTGVAVPEIMKSVWNYDISICPCCGKRSMRHAGRTFALLN